MNASPWAPAYRLYRDWEKRIYKNPDLPFLGTLLKASAEGAHHFNEMTRDWEIGVREGRLPNVPTALQKDLDYFADLATRCQGYSAPYEDVYHMAFAHISWWRGLGQPVPQAKDCTQLYRGQKRDTWGIESSILRGLAPENFRAELESRVLTAFGHTTSISRNLNIPFQDAAAVAQHYGTATWLVDFSRDPWTSLFFASDGGEEGEVGIVWSIFPTEYAAYAVGLGNTLGGLRVTVPQGIPRIENQHGVFLESALPALFEQYVAPGYHTRFRQHRGLCFEDPVLGISREHIYPEEEGNSWMPLNKDTSAFEPGLPSAWRNLLENLSLKVDQPVLYERMLAAWDQNREWEKMEDILQTQAALRRLARFHALLHSPRYENRLSVLCKSLTCLRTAFEYIMKPETPSSFPPGSDFFLGAVWRYFNHADPGDRKILSEALSETEK